MQKVTVVGPNMPAPFNKRGEFHVHAAGCQDLGKLKRVHGFTFEFASKQDVVEDTYYDQLAEDEDNDWTLYATEFYFAPCVQLPETS